MEEYTALKVSLRGATIRPGEVAYVKCQVPADVCSSDSLVLFEPKFNSLPLEKLDIGEGLMEVHQADRLYVEVPIGNHTKQDVTLPSRTVIGSIEPIEKIIEVDKSRESQEKSDSST